MGRMRRRRGRDDGRGPMTGALMLFANPEGLAQARRLEGRCEECGWWKTEAMSCPLGLFPRRCAAARMRREQAGQDEDPAP